MNDDVVIAVKAPDFEMLRRMVARGWSDVDLAEYISTDQIVSCERILKLLGLSLVEGQPHPQAASARPSPTRK
jgi:hypothetical protein